MLVAIEDQKYIVKFQHDMVGITVLNDYGKLVHNSNRSTKCIIRNVLDDRDKFVGVGYAKCHPTDNFVKETGRMLSLVQAIEDGGFTREEKQIICSAYKNRKPIK